MVHIPVLQKEVLEYLDPKPNQNFIDCTIGGGGHTLAILERILPKGRILGIDWSPELIQDLKIKIQKAKLKSSSTLVCDNFTNLKEIVKREKFREVSGILFDLGMSSWHLKESKRGFSFLRNGSLDMRYNSQNPSTTEKIVNCWSRFEIEKILREYGEERFAKKIAEKIIEARRLKPIKTTFQLVEIIRRGMQKKYLNQRIHFATRTFQALRIAVNDELNNLKKALPQAVEILKPEGRLVVISFHSLEDRIIKNFYRDSTPEKLEILTKKPIRPSVKEIKINSCSRSAKLRAAIKL